MEGLLHYSTNWILFFAVIGMVVATDVIDYIIDKWDKK